MPDSGLQVVPRREQESLPVLPVVFSSDDTYAPYVAIAISSLLEFISGRYFYDLIILDNGISKPNRVRLLGLVSGIDNASLRFHSVETLATSGATRGQFSKAAYLTLYIPWLFRGHGKVLYLDCDMIVRQDIAELFDLDFNGEYIAAVRDTAHSEHPASGHTLEFNGVEISWSDYLRDYLSLQPGEFNDAVNTGTVMYNIPAFEEDRFSVLDDLDTHIEFGYYLVDQCIINKLLKGRIKHLHPRWNLQVLILSPEHLPEAYSSQFADALTNPAIVHYVGHRKPWNSFFVAMDEFFWSVARQTDWYFELWEKRCSEGYRRWINQSEVTFQTTDSPTPLFSIVMPIQNREYLVNRSITALMLQQYTDFELILVDRESRDNTAALAREWSGKDARVRLVRLESDPGTEVAWNEGLSIAKGKYVGFYAPGEFYAPEALAVFAHMAVSQGADLMAGNACQWSFKSLVARIDPSAGRIETTLIPGDMAATQAPYPLLTISQYMIRRSFLQEHSVGQSPVQQTDDLTHIARLVARARSIALVPDPLLLCMAN